MKPIKKELKIELFLETINQEKLRTTPSIAGCDYYASWPKSCCIADFSIVKPEDLVSHPVRGLLLRDENPGGLMWNPRTSAVYKLNEEAFHAVKDLEKGLNANEIAEKQGLNLKQVEDMINQLRMIAK